jgi:hypothetical protein
MELERKVVRATYTCEEEFKIPIGIDLEDKSQVEKWGVKWNTLHIWLKNGKHIEVKGYYNQPREFDWKRPDDVNIDDDENIYDSDCDKRWICPECCEDITKEELETLGKVAETDIVRCKKCDPALYN